MPQIRSALIMRDTVAGAKVARPGTTTHGHDLRTHSGGSKTRQAVATPAFDSLYCISFTEQGLLADRAQMAAAVNAAHEILLRCDPAEIAGYIRARKVRSLLQVIERLSAGLRDQLIKLKPKFGLPGG